MASKDNLGDRMKSNYEDRSKAYLTRRTPTIIRLDGCHFHTFTKGFRKPFDEILIKAMQLTTYHLCKSIQGCVLGYTQSDEITLVLNDYTKLETDAWFDYNIQKICSVSSSIATLHFNKEFSRLVKEFGRENKIDGESELFKVMCSYVESVEKGATFDARCFNIPKEEVTNCLLWREQDAIRNSINSLGQAYFSHKKLMGKNTSDVKKMLLGIGVSWDDLEPHKQRGTCIIKDMFGQWEMDKEIPIFKNEGRAYIDKLIV